MRLVCAAFAAAQEPARRRPPARGVLGFVFERRTKKQYAVIKEQPDASLTTRAQTTRNLKWETRHRSAQPSEALMPSQQFTRQRSGGTGFGECGEPLLVRRCEDSTAAARMRETNWFWACVFSGSGRCRDAWTQNRPISSGMGKAGEGTLLARVAYSVSRKDAKVAPSPPRRHTRARGKNSGSAWAECVFSRPGVQYGVCASGDSFNAVHVDTPQPDLFGGER